MYMIHSVGIDCGELLYEFRYNTVLNHKPARLTPRHLRCCYSRKVTVVINTSSIFEYNLWLLCQRCNRAMISNTNIGLIELKHTIDSWELTESIDSTKDLSLCTV